jgi:hypothetical protein
MGDDCRGEEEWRGDERRGDPWDERRGEPADERRGEPCAVPLPRASARSHARTSLTSAKCEAIVSWTSVWICVMRVDVDASNRLTATVLLLLDELDLAAPPGLRGDTTSASPF